MSFIPVNNPILGEEEKKNLIECINTNWISSGGPFVKKFEQQLSELTQRNFVLTVSNGTAALELALKSLDLQPGDEVILPTLTIISCAQAISKLGAIPVPVDVDDKSFLMKTEQVKECINSKTKAIMAVHLYGLPVDMNPLITLAKKYKLWLIEDAAESIGQNYRGKPCGGFGDISIFSFYPNKHITTGEGGAILTNHEKIYKRSLYYHNLCFSEDPDKRFIHRDLGWNLRFTNIQAAIGVAQIKKLSRHLEIKKKIGERYTQLLKTYDQWLQLPLDELDGNANSYWVYPVVIKEDFSLNAQQLMNQLRSHKIDSRPFFYPIHQQPVYSDVIHPKVDLSISEKLYQRGFYLPSGIGLKESSLKRVVEAISLIIKKNS